MNQENGYSKGCKVKDLLKSKTSVDLVAPAQPERYRQLDLKNAKLWFNMTFLDAWRLFRESVIKRPTFLGFTSDIPVKSWTLPHDQKVLYEGIFHKDQSSANMVDFIT